MIRMLAWLLLIYIGYRVVLALFAGRKPIARDRDAGTGAATTYRDPVCGMYVSEEDAIVGKLDGQRHYFCSMACLDKYREQLDHKS